MADNRREQERAELYKSIWGIANDLRGSVDGWDFKNYVLTTLFYRYISENLTNYINKGEQEAGNEDFDYATMPDEDAEGAREGLIDELSLVTAPVTADPDDLPLLSKSSIHSWNLESVSDHSGILVSKYSKQKDC